MKKLTALILALMLCLSTAYAAEWAEGLSPSQPYSHKPAVNLDEMMGYMTLFPNANKKIVAERFCDVLEMYFPRDDVELGEGNLTLCDDSGEVLTISFTDPASVEVRPLEEIELDGLLWGSGCCVEIYLPYSLKFDTNYYVLMDEGCLTASGGKVKSPQISNEKAWIPQVVTEDYGISGLYYSAPAEKPEEGEEASAEETAKAEEASGPVAFKVTPEVGDVITFDLVMGGDAKYAVVYSENGSVYFETLEYTESGTVTGAVTGEELDWGVVFLDEEGEVLDIVDVK